MGPPALLHLVCGFPRPQRGCLVPPESVCKAVMYVHFSGIETTNLICFSPDSSEDKKQPEGECRGVGEEVDQHWRLL